LRAFQEGNSCLLSPGAPDSPVHHRTMSGADFFPSLAKPTVGGSEPLAHRTLSGAHRTVRCTPNSLVPPSDRRLCHASRVDYAADRWPGRLLAHRTVRCTPDSLVNFSRTPPTISRERPVRRCQPGAPDTVRCTTGQSGAPRLSRLLAASSQAFSIEFSLILALRQTC
jgi:hypothetical protein